MLEMWSADASGGEMTEIWGHKIILYAYLPGSDLAEADEMAEQIVQQVNNADDHGDLSFIGVKIEEVPDEPKEQISS